MSNTLCVEINYLIHQEDNLLIFLGYILMSFLIFAPILVSPFNHTDTMLKEYYFGKDKIHSFSLDAVFILLYFTFIWTAFVQLYDKVKLNKTVLLVLITCLIVILFDGCLVPILGLFKPGSKGAFIKKWGETAGMYAIGWDLFYLNTILLGALTLFKLNRKFKTNQGILPILGVVYTGALLYV